VAGIAGPNWEGVNIKGSLSIGSRGLPDKLVDLLGPSAAMVQDMWGAGEALVHGDYERAAETAAPRILKGPLRAFREAHDGVTSGRTGKPIWYGDEQIKADEWATALRSIGANPASVSEKREKQWNESEVSAKYKKMRSDIYDDLDQHALHGGTQKEYDAIVKRVDEFNEGVVRKRPLDVSQISDESMRATIRGATTAPKKERERGDTTPIEQEKISDTYEKLTAPRGSSSRSTGPRRVRRERPARVRRERTRR
jgi:hypothetical protein